MTVVTPKGAAESEVNGDKLLDASQVNSLHYTHSSPFITGISTPCSQTPSSPPHSRNLPSLLFADVRHRLCLPILQPLWQRLWPLPISFLFPTLHHNYKSRPYSLTCSLSLPNLLPQPHQTNLQLCHLHA